MIAKVFVSVRKYNRQKKKYNEEIPKKLSACMAGDRKRSRGRESVENTKALLCDKLQIVTKLQITQRMIFLTTIDSLCFGRPRFVVWRILTMFSNVKLGISNSINVISLIISFITVLFVLAGFLRIEIKLNDQDAKMAVIQRLCADERIQKPSAEFEGKK